MVKIEHHLPQESLRTAEEIRAALDDGLLNKIPGFGARSKRELLQWLDCQQKRICPRPDSDT